MANTTNHPVLSVVATKASRLSDLVIEDGRLIFVTDAHRIALDYNGKRTFYNQIEELSSDADRKAILAPITGRYYFVIETAVLWTYQNGWVPLTTRPEDIVFIGTSFPELGQPCALYANKAEQNISVWDEDEQRYIEVADTTGVISASDINKIFN